VYQKFSPKYINEAFLIWYQNGKPSARMVHNLLPPDEFGEHPSVDVVASWIKEDFDKRAEELDRQINAQIAARMVQVKVEMLERHAEIGQEMQETALRWIDEHKDDLSPSSVIRLLVEGVRIERESRGVPEALEDIAKKSDEQLLEEIQKLFKVSPVNILPAGEAPDEK